MVKCISSFQDPHPQATALEEALEPPAFTCPYRQRVPLTGCLILSFLSSWGQLLHTIHTDTYHQSTSRSSILNGPLVLGRDPRRALNVLTPPLSHLCYIYSHRHPQIIDFAVYAMSRKEAEKAQQQPHLLRFIYISSGNLRKRLKAVFLI